MGVVNPACAARRFSSSVLKRQHLPKRRSPEPNLVKRFGELASSATNHLGKIFTVLKGREQQVSQPNLPDCREGAKDSVIIDKSGCQHVFVSLSEFSEGSSGKLRAKCARIIHIVCSQKAYTL
jgi:hypothetical protein